MFDYYFHSKRQTRNNETHCQSNAYINLKNACELCNYNLCNRESIKIIQHNAKQLAHRAEKQILNCFNTSKYNDFK